MRTILVTKNVNEVAGQSDYHVKALQELAVRSYRVYREERSVCVRVQYEKITFYAVTRFFLQTARKMVLCGTRQREKYVTPEGGGRKKKGVVLYVRVKRSIRKTGESCFVFSESINE